MSQQNEPLLKNAQDGVQMYQQMKFDVAAEGYKVINKQILEPKPTCALCSSSDNSVMGCKVNDNHAKVQTIASLCNDCGKILHKLGEADIEDQKVQRLIRLFFPENADKIINGQFAEKRVNKYHPIFVEYWALIKWSIEEKLIRQLIQALPLEDTEGYTRVRCGDCCSCITNEVTFDPSGISDVAESVDLYSPIRECWMNLEVCTHCKKQIELDLRDMEHEIRTSYYDDYKDYQDKPRRESLEILCQQIHNCKDRVLFLDTASKKDAVINILNACGVDDEHQIITKVTERQDHEADVKTLNENIQEQIQEPALESHNNCFDN
jgi:hypothetical protein